MKEPINQIYTNLFKTFVYQGKWKYQNGSNKFRIRLNCFLGNVFGSCKVLLRISFYYNWIIKPTSICFRQILSLDGSDTPHSLYLTIVTVVIIMIMKSPWIQKDILTEYKLLNLFSLNTKGKANCFKRLLKDLIGTIYFKWKCFKIWT